MLGEELDGQVCVPLRVYVAGPLRKLAPGGSPIPEPDPAFIEKAAHISRGLFARGHIPLCPHEMTRSWFGQKDPVFNDQMRIVRVFGLSLLRVSDAIYLLPGWEGSHGTRVEWAYAQEMNLWAFRSLDEVPSIKPDDGGRRDLMDARDNVSRECRRRLILGEKKHGDNWKRVDCIGEAVNELVDWQNWAFLAAEQAKLQASAKPQTPA